MGGDVVAAALDVLRVEDARRLVAVRRVNRVRRAAHGRRWQS